MVSREHKRAAMYRKLQLLRSITNSHAKSETSVISEASKYLGKLKQRVERLNQNVIAAHTQAHLPLVKLEVQEKGFLINVVAEGNCKGLLVFILEAFEELGLNVLQARVSCSDNFYLEALLGGYSCFKENQGQAENINAQGVKEAVLQAIQNWRESGDPE